jgi:hypothetical protein
MSDLVAETRPFSVACDWCGTELVGQIRHEHVGRMFVVQLAHVNPRGVRCLGSGRGIPVWPLRLELRAAGGRYELVVGDGDPIECASQEIIEAALRDFGVIGDGAKRRLADVESGAPVAFEVPERRKQPRSRREER